MEEKAVYKMRLCNAPFEMIKSGKKTIELRLNDEKRQRLNAGDRICFSNLSNPKEKLLAEIIKLHKFDSFDSLYKNLPLLKCGYDENDVMNASADDMKEYYPIERQRKYGVLGIEISLLAEVNAD